MITPRPSAYEVFRLAIIAALVGLTSLAGCDQISGSQKQNSAKSDENPFGKYQKQTVPRELETGRFTIVHSPHVERDTELLDTWTGDTWLLVQDAQGNLSWEPMSRAPKYEIAPPANK